MGHAVFDGGISLVTSAALFRGDRCLLDAGLKTVSPAGVGDASIGVVTEDVALGDLASVILHAPDKVVECRSAGAFALGATLYAAAAGEVDDAVNVVRDRFIALTAATAADELVQVLPVFYGGA